MLASVFILLIYCTLGAVAGIIGIPWTLLTGNISPLYRTGMWIAALGVRAIGVRVVVSGRENIPVNTCCIFMANHVSNLDAPVLLPLLPGRTSVLLKRSLMKIPLLGMAMRMAGFVPVDRGQHTEQGRDHAIESVSRAAEALRSGLHITLFPEGTRSPDGRLLPFKKGPFYLAAETGAPIVPVSISGTEAMMGKSTLRLTPGTARVVFHAPVWPDGKTNRETLMLRVRESIASGLPERMRG